MWSMPYKPRTESAELQILRILNYRMDLSDKEKQLFFNLKKAMKERLCFGKTSV